jgi:proteasome lid subunit RPN8/RPN11|tara:strand:- start:373 stop:792 length:420 start_codon:yes stop_codon:yes gene_type:complete
MDLVMEEIHRFEQIEDAINCIKEIAHGSFKQEICGFLGFDYDTERYLVKQETNISPEPSSYFLINPLNYLVFKEDYKMVAIFHSHIVGDETESEFDVKTSDACCQAFLIYSLNTKKINIYSPKYIEGDVKILERFKEIV